jgi:hypothetical protein
MYAVSQSSIVSPQIFVIFKLYSVGTAGTPSEIYGEYNALLKTSF